MDWKPGDWVVRREVLDAGPWFGTMVRVIEDHTDLLVSYIPENAPFGFPEGDWPTPNGKHPWAERANWQGHGCLMLQRPGERHAVWHFWGGPERKFLCWYINIQEPFRRTPFGYDTQDLELDLIVYPDGRWAMKDDDLMEQRVEEGRFSTELVKSVREYGSSLAARLDAGEKWWSSHWKDWQPDPDWSVPQKFPTGWARWASARRS